MGSPTNHKNFLLDIPPETIYFDTNFIIHSLIKQDKHYFKNLTCRYFLDRLIKSNTKVYISAIVFPEFWHTTLKIAVAKAMGFETEKEVNDHIRKYKKKTVKKHIDFIKEMQDLFDRLMSVLNEKEQRVYVVEIGKISDHCIRFMAEHQLLSYDAIHFASATIKVSAKADGDLDKPSVFDMATIDSDFEGLNCKYLNLWNKGCDRNNILKYEKSLPKEKLQPDGILLKELKQ